jgi:hypothetical protein
MTSTRSQGLRFGVMIDEPRLADWQARCIDHLLGLEGVEPVLLIENAEPRGPWLKRFLRAFFSRDFPFLVFKKLFVRAPCLRMRALPHRLDGVPILSCRVTTKGRFSQYFSEDDLEVIRDHRLDFILRFGFNIIRGGILRAARYGVWSFHHGDETRYRGSPPCFWEIYDGDRVTGTILQRLTNRLDGGVVLKRHAYFTDCLSYAGNLNKAYYASSVMPQQVCRDILNGEAGYLDGPPSRTDAPIRYNPSLLQLTVFVFKLFSNLVKRLVVHLFLHETWNVGLLDRPIHSFVDDPVPKGIAWLPAAPRGRFQADCFGIARSGAGGTVLLEYYNHRVGRGEIRYVELSQEGVSDARPPRPAIREEHHLSYPYLITKDDGLFCLPEATQSGNLTLYRAVEFPHRWIREKVLLEGVRAVDPTVVFYEERWWLFFCECAPDVRLHVWYAEDLFGGWKPCANNPVKVDIRLSRPAGTPFVHDGALYRPVQDCAEHYGRRVVLMRVTRLSPVSFAEVAVCAINPEAASEYPHGLHTLSAFGEKTLVDGKRLSYTPFKLVYQLPRLGESFRRFIKRAS